ncbi:MAG: hypothetical protein ACI9OD_000451 [Limisphaerales bacterium]|jgi:hypothetical protein
MLSSWPTPLRLSGSGLGNPSSAVGSLVCSKAGSPSICPAHFWLRDIWQAWPSIPWRGWDFVFESGNGAAVELCDCSILLDEGGGTRILTGPEPIEFSFAVQIKHNKRGITADAELARQCRVAFGHSLREPAFVAWKIDGQQDGVLCRECFPRRLRENMLIHVDAPARAPVVIGAVTAVGMLRDGGAWQV